MHMAVSSIPPGFNPAVPPPFTDAIPRPQILAQGAEGILFKSYFISPSIPCAIKYRPIKTWRHPTLDSRLTRHRILSEARILVKCRKDGISVPGVLALDWDGSSVQLHPANLESINAASNATNNGTIASDSAGKTASNQTDGSSPQSKPSRTGGWMITEWIDGLTVRRSLDAWLPKHRHVKTEPGEKEKDIPPRPQEVKELMKRIGNEIGRMHQNGVIHGDLTTSNLMLRHRPVASTTANETNGDGLADSHAQKGSDQQEVEQERPPLDGDVVLIDFGLATSSLSDEDRAVDLYVLERAFGSTHPNTEDLFDELLDAYSRTFKGARVAVKRLEDVRMRGRKKSMIG